MFRAKPVALNLTWKVFRETTILDNHSPVSFQVGNAPLEVSSDQYASLHACGTFHHDCNTIQAYSKRTTSNLYTEPSFE